MKVFIWGFGIINEQITSDPAEGLRQTVRVCQGWKTPSLGLGKDERNEGQMIALYFDVMYVVCS